MMLDLPWFKIQFSLSVWVSPFSSATGNKENVFTKFKANSTTWNKKTSQNGQSGQFKKRYSYKQTVKTGYLWFYDDSVN